MIVLWRTKAKSFIDVVTNKTFCVGKTLIAAYLDSRAQCIYTYKLDQSGDLLGRLNAIDIFDNHTPTTRQEQKSFISRGR